MVELRLHLFNSTNTFAFNHNQTVIWSDFFFFSFLRIRFKLIRLRVLLINVFFFLDKEKIGRISLINFTNNVKWIKFVQNPIQSGFNTTITKFDELQVKPLRCNWYPQTTKVLIFFLFRTLISILVQYLKLLALCSFQILLLMTLANGVLFWWKILTQML